MTFLKILFVCTILARCPCCGKGSLFRGWFSFRPACDTCGLVYEQWVGDWTSATWIAHSVGFLAALGVFVWMFATDVGMNGPLSPEFSIALLAALFSLLALRSSKSLWLGVMYWAGGVEVSARSRAWLQWFASRSENASTNWMIAEAKSRAARSVFLPAHRAFLPSARPGSGRSLKSQRETAD